MVCTKAIIPVAGFGTRMLPLTRAIEKCMLPIMGRPIIDYVVGDCIAAGVTDIYFVVAQGSGQQLQAYYQKNDALDRHLHAQHKTALLPFLELPQGVRFHYVEQDIDDHARYGTTIPVWLCRDLVTPDEYVLVLMGDDFLYNVDGSSETARLIAAVAASGAGSALLGVPIPKAAVSQYGVIAAHQDGEVLRFDHIQEKPKMEDAKSNLINVSKYLFEAHFWQYIAQSVDTHTGSGEYQITDPLNAYVADGNILQVVMARGQYLDSGTPERWLHANNFVAQNPIVR